MLSLSSRWVLSAILAAVAGAILGLTGLAPTIVSAGVSHSHYYTHSSSSCSGHVDPIDDVFVVGGFASWVDNHAGHHGGWTYSDGSDQWFAAHICWKQDQQAASNSQWDPRGRYHMRIGYGYSASGGNDSDPTWGYWSAADAHHEDVDWCGHTVDDNLFEPPGGFNMGRNDIYKNWVQSGAHTYRLFGHWGNTARFTQCAGSVAWSDGYVDYIEVRTSS